MDTETLIIGAGIHGTSIAHRLGERSAVLDSQEPLAQWKRYTRNTGMTALRSGPVHHLGTQQYELLWRQPPNEKSGQWLKALHKDIRPRLQFFNEHAQEIADTVQPRWQCATATAIHPIESGWRVETTRGDCSAYNVILATGFAATPRIPEWAREREDTYHVFSDADIQGLPVQGQRVAVVGGGITAGQVALSMHEKGANVTIISTHELQEKDVDSDPKYLRARELASFQALPPETRVRIARTQRYPGTMPWDVYRPLRELIRQGNIEHRVTQDEPNGTLSFDGRPADIAILATGLTGAPGGTLLHQVENQYGLQRIDEVPNTKNCRWAYGLYVSGTNAQASLGPFAGNIWGAMQAGEAIERQIRN